MLIISKIYFDAFEVLSPSTQKTSFNTRMFLICVICPALGMVGWQVMLEIYPCLSHPYLQTCLPLSCLPLPDGSTAIDIVQISKAILSITEAIKPFLPHYWQSFCLSSFLKFLWKYSWPLNSTRLEMPNPFTVENPRITFDSLRI